MSTSFIDISKLRERTGNEFSVTGELRIETVRLGAEEIVFAEPVRYSLALRNVGEGILVKGTVDGSAVLRCSRCLEKFTYELAVPVDEIAVFASPDKEEGQGDAMTMEGPELDIHSIVYQNVVVSIPMRPLCREMCAGICPRCGKDLNVEPHSHEETEVDDRLAPLKAFFEKKQEGR